MEKTKIITIPILGLLLSGCSLVKGMEHNLNVVFEYNGQILSSTTVSEFKNGASPTLSEEMIPLNHRFYGWTWLNPDSINIGKYTDEKNRVTDEFYTNFISYDDVVHYDEIKDHSYNTTVVLKPLFINEDAIPVPSYYIAIGWYAKTSTSGLNASKVEAWTEDLKTYLSSKGATAENLEDIIITPYEGDVATAGSLVNKDKFNDILIGFGNNIGTTGGVEFIENVGGITMGGKSRYITKLNTKTVTEDVFTWLQTEDGHKSLA